MSEGEVAGALAGRVALVTGAASGIGRGVVDRFVAEGAEVVAFDRSEEGLALLSEAHGGRVAALAGVVRSAADNQRAADLAAESFGGLDAFVGNAGVFDASLPLTSLPPEQLAAAAGEVFEINVVGYLLGARAVAEQLRERRGAMVFTVSNAGFHPGSGGGILYTTSKHAVVGLVRQLAFELAPEVRVNGVAPGGTLTGLRIADRLQGLAHKAEHFEDVAAARRAIAATNPLGTVPSAADHAGLYLLLAGDGAPAVTGEIIASDGGLAVRGLDLEESKKEDR